MDQDVGYLFPELLAKHRYAVIALQTIVTTSTTPKTAPATTTDKLSLRPNTPDNISCQA